jgi:nitrite reductase/ring-hydroxylating ferredoxin subunit
MPTIELLLHEIPWDSPFHVSRDGVNIVVIRSKSGVSAFEDVCPHAFWPLSQGQVNDGVLECPGHGWEFHVETGRCLNAPAYCLTSVAVLVDGERICLEYESRTVPGGRQLAGAPQAACKGA